MPEKINALVRIYVPDPLEGTAIAQPFWFRFPERKGFILFDKKLPESFFQSGADFTDITKASIVILPNNFTRGDAREQEYITRHADAAEKYRTPLFIFSGGDFTDRLRFDSRAYVFRQSLYRSTMQPQDIVMPTITEDNAKDGIMLRRKQLAPVVSFCGQGDYKTLRQHIIYHLKVWTWRVASFFKPVLRARIIGVYWRKKMMRACEKSALVHTNFIVRRSFSGAHRTIELDPAQARKEYLDSIVNADFVLAPKGDGNYSNRFLKTLCMGRIPVLPDTDIVLPLEEYIEYDSLVVRVPMDRIEDTPALVRKWYDALSDAEWEDAERKAREVFETHLRFDSFFRYFFVHVLPRLPLHPQQKL